ncbi:MAG: hypothetical protein R3A46_04380 [Thermomicrobiales bacterium]
MAANNWSTGPVAVAVDATKYPESTTSDDPNIFQAMSYSATANVYTTQAFPLVQKGNPDDGSGRDLWYQRDEPERDRCSGDGHVGESVRLRRR